MKTENSTQKRRDRVVNTQFSLGSKLVPSYLTKSPFDHLIIEDKQSILVLPLTISGYTLCVSNTKINQLSNNIIIP